MFIPNSEDWKFERTSRQLEHIIGLLEGINRRLERFERRISYNPPSGFVVSMSGADSPGKESTMAKAHATGVDQQFLDNGKIRITLTVVDANGSATDPATGNPVVLPVGTPPVVLTDSASKLTFVVDPSDTSGFGLIQLGTASGDTVGDVVTATTTLPGAAAPITGSGDPFDIVPVPVTADNPAGFAVVESQA